MRTLIVEDEKISRMILEKTLAPYGPCASAADGREALDAFKAAWDRGEPYDLVCLDIMMPEMDGHAVLQQIRAFEREKNTESDDKRAIVIMTTCLDSKDSFVKALDSGSEWYLTKPLSKAKLIEVLQDLGLLK